VKLCLVTDRRRLAPGASSESAARRCLCAQARYAVEAQIDLIQLRERDLPAGQLAALAADLLAITAGTGTRLVINDRLDVALACGADGVHLRGESMPVAAARQLAPPPLLIGRSVHAASEASAAAGADYVIAGTVFPSVSKPALEAGTGLEGLTAIVRAVSRPVLAIGGVTVERTREVAETGASGIAAISLFIAIDARTLSCRAVPLRGIADAVRREFDSREPPS
jgi:thiamine-phosphate pyrophosphorylase